VLQYAPHGEATRDIQQLVAWVDDWVGRAVVNPLGRA